MLNQRNSLEFFYVNRCKFIINSMWIFRVFFGIFWDVFVNCQYFMDFSGIFGILLGFFNFFGILLDIFVNCKFFWDFSGIFRIL